MSDLAIIATYFNPQNYKSRKDNTNSFLKYIEESGVSDHLYIAEIVYPDQEPFIKHKNTIHLKCESPVWNKEAALNVITKKLPRHYTKVMWVDLDVRWLNGNWYNDISKLLDSHKVVQPFANCLYLDHDSTIDKIGIGYFKFVKENIDGGRICYGMAAAYTREFCDKFGFFDKFLLGAGDTIMSLPIAGDIDRLKSWCLGFCFDDIKEEALEYAENIKNYVNGNYAFYEEDIIHIFHGKLSHRHSYRKREIVGDLKFADLYEKNSYELYEIIKNNNNFLNTCNDFFKERQEDYISPITLQGNIRSGVERSKNGRKFLWLPPKFILKFSKSCKIKLHLKRSNRHCTKFLNIYRTNKPIDQRIFDDRGVLLIELDVLVDDKINFSGDFFIPSENYRSSTDNRELSCTLQKIEVSYDTAEFEQFSLENL